MCAPPKVQDGVKVLILEDDPSIYGIFLTGEGWDVSLCTSFEAARQSLRESVPDVLLTDVRVGEYNGLQLVILYKSVAPGGRVFVVSGHDDPVIRREAEAMGAEFMVKPVDLRILKQRIGEPGP